MPEKPTRRERRRTGQRPVIARRPRPAPPINPERVSRPEPTPSATATAMTAHPPPQMARPAAAGTPARPERRPGAGISAARVTETQRVERVRREAFRDLRRIALVAAITLVLLAVATLIVR